MTRANTPAHFLSHVRQGSHLSQLLVNAQQHAQEQDSLATLLPAALRDQVLIRQEQDDLWLVARNNAVAQLVRFQGQKLLAASGCTRLHLRVGDVCDSVAQATPRTTPPTMPTAVGQLLLDAAADMDDPTLAAALRRLAQNVTSQP